MFGAGESKVMTTESTRAPIMLMRIGGVVVAYLSLAAFLCLISVQIYRWFREGEWTHIGISDSVRAVLSGCCVSEGDAGLLAGFVHWIDTPTDWLGWHKVLEVIPASIVLFSFSMLGNFVYIYGSDRRNEQLPNQTSKAA
jgi:hypothetical protein